MKSLCRGGMDRTDGSYPLDCNDCHEKSCLKKCNINVQNSFLKRFNNIMRFLVLVGFPKALRNRLCGDDISKLYNLHREYLNHV